MNKADQIKVLDSLVVAVVSDFRNHLCCSALHLMSRLKFFLNRIALHVRDVGRLWICIMGGSVLYFCTWNCGQWTSVLCWPFCRFSLFIFATWGLWWWWFKMDPTVDLLSTTVDLICYSCSACCCVRCASQNIYLHLSTLKLICHLLAHSTSLLICSCSSIMSSAFLALWQSLVLSANLDIFLTIIISRSFIYIINSSGPNALACGTPDVTGAQLL